MRLRLFYGVAGLSMFLGACHLDPAKSCHTTADCGGSGRCDTQTNTCVIAVCNPACGFGQYCATSTASCEVAHTGVALTSPVAGKVGRRVRVHATLTPSHEEPHEDPAELSVTVVSQSSGGTQTPVTLSRLDGGDGEYEGVWNPNGTGVYELQVADTGLATTPVEVTADLDAPTFFVDAPAHAARPSSGTTTYEDVGMPGAYRRDETATVWVKSAATDVDPGSVRVSVTGTGAASVAGTPVWVMAGCDAGYCGKLDVDLSKPEMNAYHTRFQLAVSGMDDGGNSSVDVADAGTIGVTRFKWAFNAPDTFHIVASPAIGRDGTIYVGSADPSTNAKGTLYAVSPDGARRWSMDAGAVEVSPSVGAALNGYEDVFVAGTSGTASGDLWALNSNDGGVTASCTGYGRPRAALAVATTTLDGGTSDSAVSADSAAYLLMLRTAALLTPERCPTKGLATAPAPPGNLAITGQRFFVPTGAQISWADFTDAGWSPPSGFDSKTVASVLALSGARFLYSTSPGVGAINADGGSYANFTSTPTLGNTFGPIVSADAGGFVGEASGLVNVDLANMNNSRVIPAGAGSVTSPVVGEGGLLYLSAGTGLQVWRPGSSAPEWEVSDAGVAAQDVPLSIDCSRAADGAPISAPGVLYVKSGSTSLSAIVVDSHGIDTTAPWPKYQHDPRNTGNADTPMSDFVCP